MKISLHWCCELGTSQSMFVAVFAYAVCSTVCSLDSELLIDLITGSETSALELVVAGCKAMVVSVSDTTDLDETDCNPSELQEFFSLLADQLARMGEKNLLPFNVAPLLRRLHDVNTKLHQLR